MSEPGQSPEENIHRDRSAGSQRTSSRGQEFGESVLAWPMRWAMFTIGTPERQQRDEAVPQLVGVQAIRSIPACRVVPLCASGQQEV